MLGALDSDVRQFVVLGAGYDGRSLRYAAGGVRWFEVDRAVTQADKMQRLRRLGIHPGARFVAADFALDDVAAALGCAGLDPTLEALLICEGVAVYLDADVLARLAAQVRTVVCRGSRLVITVGASSARSGVTAFRRQFEDTVAAVGEPARSRLGADAAGDLLAHAGWQVVDAGDPVRGFLVARAV